MSATRSLGDEHELQPVAQVRVDEAPVPEDVDVGEAGRSTTVENVPAMVVEDERSLWIERVAVVLRGEEIDDFAITYDGPLHGCLRAQERDREVEPAPGSQDAEAFGQAPVDVRDVLEDVVRDDGAE